MDLRGHPSALPAAAFVLGATFAPWLSYRPLGILFVLLALGIGVGRRAGWFLAALIAGVLVTHLATEQGEAVLTRFDLNRPVELVGRSIAHPAESRDADRLLVRAACLRQGQVVARARFDIWVSLPTASGGEAPPGIGAGLRLRGYLRRSPGAWNLSRGEPGPWRMRLKSRRLLSVEPSRTVFSHLATRLRRGVEERLAEQRADKEGTAQGRALLRALLLGDRSRLPESWAIGLRRAGLSHLLAVSGLHVGLAGWVAWLLGMPAGRAVRYAAALLTISAYLLLVGPRPSVWRAVAMAALAYGALLGERPPRALHALGCCAIWLVAVKPERVGELGFQLSFAATAALLLAAEPLADRWRRLPAWLRWPLAATVVAQVATLPFLLPHQGGLTLLAPFLNLPAVPWLVASLVASLLWLPLSAVGLGSLPLAALELLSRPMTWLCSWPPEPLFMPLSASETGARVGALAVLSWLGWWLSGGACRPRIVALVGALLLLSGAGRYEDPELVALDVGQGDALLLRDGRRAVLIDGGGWPAGDIAGKILVPTLARLGVHRLDAVLLSHPDRDHCGGLRGLARYLPIDEVWMSPGWNDSDCTADLATQPAISWRPLWAGHRLSVGRFALRVLHPAAGDRGSGNDRSLVVLVEAHGRRLLLTGDIESSAERRLARDLGKELRADVLKAAHHGSRTSSTALLLAAVSPRLVLISAGRGNPYGHPAAAALERLENGGARVLRTDEVGLIRLRFPSGGPIRIELPGSGG